MLDRVLAALAACVALVVMPLGLSGPAHAEGDQNCWWQRDPRTGELKFVCEDGGGDPGNGDPGGGSSTCSHQGKVIPCEGPAGSAWNGTCYVGGPVPRQPPRGPNGLTIPDDGEYHMCYFPPGVIANTFCFGTPCVWVGAGETFIDPVMLAYRAIASMDLDPITIGIVPESGPNRVGLVGLPVWMWADDQTEDTWGPITRSASEGPVSVSATARVSGLAWDMGDGATVACTGAGTPYADRYGKQDSPTCGHRYAEMSSSQPDGAYQVTATSHWVIEWTGGGQSGTIELDLTTAPLPIRVGEAQVLTQ